MGVNRIPKFKYIYDILIFGNEKSTSSLKLFYNDRMYMGDIVYIMEWKSIMIYFKI